MKITGEALRQCASSCGGHAPYSALESLRLMSRRLFKNPWCNDSSSDMNNWAGGLISFANHRLKVHLLTLSRRSVSSALEVKQPYIKPRPRAVQNFCPSTAANQKEVGLKANKLQGLVSDWGWKFFLNMWIMQSYLSRKEVGNERLL